MRRPGEGTVVLSSSSDGPIQVSGDLVIDFDARALVDVGRRAILPVIREDIMEGRAPDGSPQPPLSKRAALQPRESDHRGFKTGELADGLVATAIKGTETSASCTIRGPTNRNVVLGKEAKRGRFYIAMGPRAEAAAMEAIDGAVDAMLEGRKVEMEQGEPTSREEASS